MGCICKLLSVVLFVIRKNGIQYLFQSVLRKTVIHNRICRFQESYCDAVALKAMEIMVEVDKYCLTNPLFQSMITISIYISISLRHTAVSNSFNRVRGLRNFQCKIKYKREEDVMADFLKRNRAEVVRMCLYEYDEEKQREFDREEGREEGREEERQNTLREKARADEAFRKIAILEKQLAELMK